MNGVGLEFNHLFGYGVLDAGAMVALAKKWKTVPPRYHCEAGSVLETQWVYFHSLYDSISRARHPQEGGEKRHLVLPFRFLSVHKLTIACKIEGLNQITIGGWGRSIDQVAYPIFFLSYFSLFVSTSPISFHFSRGIHRALKPLFEKRINTPIFLFQGSDERSIDLVENKDWCLRGDRVRCQLSGTRTGRHFRERYAAWRFGTVSNLPHGYQVINFELSSFGFIITNRSNEFISFQIDDSEPENKRRRPQRRFHEMAFHDHSYLGRVSSRELVVGGIERFEEESSSFSPFFSLSLVRKSSISNILSIKFRPGELQYSNTSTRMDQRVDPDAARHQRAALHRASGSGSTFEIGDREESARGTIVGYVTNKTTKKTLDTFISRDVHASTSLIV